MYTASKWISYFLAAGGLVEGIQLNLQSVESIKSAARITSSEMLTFYTGNQTGDTPGNLPPPYYWWEAGAMFMHLIDYYYFTGDPSNNPAIIQAMTWQGGSDGTLMPANQTKSEGNDDQVFWAFAAMEAAEFKFPPPPEDYPSWAAMAQAVFNQQTTRWDDTHCSGGLRWQIFLGNLGYDYKNIPSNGGFFQLAARLARYTNNDTYVHWAEKTWDWISTSSLYDASGGEVHRIYDGAWLDTDCQKPNPAQFSYNYGILIGGLAYMYDHTRDEKWMGPLQGLVNGLLHLFFTQDDVIFEAGCEPYHACTTDGLTFKSFSLRWLTLAAQLVPSLSDQIWPYLQASAMGAAGQCSGGDSGTVCGYDWTSSTWDESTGVGQQMSALAAIGANMIQADNLPGPLTLNTGAISKQDPNAGTNVEEDALKPITAGDRAGAAILTVIFFAMLFSGTYWLLVVETDT